MVRRDPIVNLGTMTGIKDYIFDNDAPLSPSLSDFGNAPLDDEVVNYILHEPADFEAGSSRMQANVDQSQQSNENLGSRNQVMALENLGSQNQVTVLAQIQAAIPCTCCQVLREMVYTKDTNCEKLEIHGRVGFINHALHYKNMAPSSSHFQCEMIDFCGKSITEVKDFLMEYCQSKHTEGYSISKDPFSAYYEALCVGLDWKKDNFANEMEQETHRLPLAVQGNKIAKMNRTKTMTLSDLRDYFHLPLNQVAEQLNLSRTALTQICRREKLAEWPFVKVNSLLNQILLLRERSAESADEATKATIEAEISGLEQKMIQEHCRGIAPTVLNFKDV